MQATPLQQAHQKLNAAFSEVAGWAIPEHFGNVAAEYEAARTGAAIADASHRGRIVARGKDTLDLLNRLSTNLVDPLPPGRGAVDRRHDRQGPRRRLDHRPSLGRRRAPAHRSGASHGSG